MRLEIVAIPTYHTIGTSYSPALWVPMGKFYWPNVTTNRPLAASDWARASLKGADEACFEYTKGWNVWRVE